MTQRAPAYTVICAAPYPGKPLGFMQISVSNVAAGLSGTSASNGAIVVGSLPSQDITYALVSVDSVNVRFRDDGVAPTSTVGVQMTSTSTVNGIYTLATNFAAVQFISVAGAATVNFSFYQ